MPEPGPAPASRIRVPRHLPEPRLFQLERELQLARELQGHAAVTGLLARMGEGLDQARVAEQRKHLAASLRVTPGVSPYLHKLLEAVRKILHVELPVELYVEPSADINAFCMSLPENGGFLIVVTSAAVERFSERELLFLMGHELGHGLLGHHALPVTAMLHYASQDQPLPWPVALQMMSWSRCCEISADRFGMLCCQDARVASRAFLKLASRLPDRFLGASEDFLGQAEDWMQGRDGLEGTDLTHPLLPIRVHCAHVFAESEYLSRLFGPPETPPKYSVEQANAYAEEQLQQMDPDPRAIQQEEHAAEEQAFVALAGFGVMAADGEVDDAEWQGLVAMVGEGPVQRAHELACHANGEPLWQALRKVGEGLRGRIGRPERFRLLMQVAYIAAVDGHVHPEEVKAIQVAARALDVPPHVAEVVVQRTLSGQNPFL